MPRRLLSDVHAVTLAPLVAVRTLPLYADPPMSRPTTVTLAAPVAAVFVPITELAALPLYVIDDPVLPTSTPADAWTLTPADTPDEAFVTLNVSDLHTVADAAVAPDRTVELDAVIPIPDPTTVTDVAPVVAWLVAMTLLTVVSVEKLVVMVPGCRDTVARSATEPTAAVDRPRTELSDVHCVAWAPVCPLRTAPL